MSEEASLEMESVPTEPTAAATVMVSLWQRNMIGLRAERFCSWKRAMPLRSQTLRTPPEEMKTPRLRSSLDARSGPCAGCSMA